MTNHEKEYDKILLAVAPADDTNWKSFGTVSTVLNEQREAPALPFPGQLQTRLGMDNVYTRAVVAT